MKFAVVGEDGEYVVTMPKVWDGNQTGFVKAMEAVRMHILDNYHHDPDKTPEYQFEFGEENAVEGDVETAMMEDAFVFHFVERMCKNPVPNLHAFQHAFDTFELTEKDAYKFHIQGRLHQAKKRFDEIVDLLKLL